MVPNVICHVLQGPLDLTVLMNVIATTMPLVTLWMAGVNVKLASLESVAKNTAQRDTGVKTVIERANAKMPISFVTLFGGVFAGLDLLVHFISCYSAPERIL